MPPAPAAPHPHPAAGVRRHFCAGRTPTSEEFLAHCSLSGSQGAAPSAAGSCPELLRRSSFCPLPFSDWLRVGRGHAGHLQNSGGLETSGASSSLGAHFHPGPRALQPRAAPEPQDGFKSNAPVSRGKGKTPRFSCHS